MLVFLDSLLQNGQALLDPGEQKPLHWLHCQLSTKPPQVTQRLFTLYQDLSLNFPGKAPSFDEEAAWLGLRTLFILTAATAFRELELSEIKEALRASSAPLATPAAHFSADLCLHHLPALRQTIVRIADGDPLLTLIDQLGTKLPLSSVSLPLTDLPDLTLINSHPGLAQFHAERVIALSDHHRALEPSVAKIIDTLAGAHPSILIPDLLKSSP